MFRHSLAAARRRHGDAKGLEMVEFLAVFLIFMGLSVLVFQVFVLFVNAISVNSALETASQRASAQGGLTVNANNVFMSSVPENVCGGINNVGGKLSCPNIKLTSTIYKPNGEKRSSSSCPGNETVSAGEECSRFGDIIKLSVSYKQPLIWDYQCLAESSESCAGSPGALSFKQSLAVGSQSIIGENKFNPTP